MSKGSHNESGGSFLGKLIGLLMFVVTVCFAIVLFYVFQAQDLSDIEGNGGEVVLGSSRDLTAVLEKAIEGQYSVVLTEEEMNRMLQETLELKQAGKLASWVSIKSVLVRLEDGYAEVILVRDVAGREFTQSIFVQVQQAEDQKGLHTEVYLHGGAYHEGVPSLTKGGRFGKMVVPQGFLMLVMPDFQKIAEALEPEIKLAFRDMARYEIEEGRVTLDPRLPSREAGSTGDTF